MEAALRFYEGQLGMRVSLPETVTPEKVNVAMLEAGGARLLGEPRTGAGGHPYVFVHPASTGGVLLELIPHQER